MSEANGHFREDVAQIKDDVREMKDDLAVAIKELNAKLQALTNSLNVLNVKWQSFSDSLLNSVPIKAVMWMFIILALTIVLVIAGIEGIRALAPSLPGILS